MRRYKREQRKFRKQKKYNTFSEPTGVAIFLPAQLEKIKKQIAINGIRKRLDKVRQNLIMSVGENNAKRLSTYPLIANGIFHNGICMNCGRFTKLIRFDSDHSLCENCASENNLI